MSMGACRTFTLRHVFVITWYDAYVECSSAATMQSGLTHTHSQSLVSSRWKSIVTDTKCCLNTGCLNPHRLRLMDRAPGSEAKPMKYSGVSVKLYMCQHWPSSVENLMVKKGPEDTNLNNETH